MPSEYRQIGFGVMPIGGVEKFTKERILTNTVGWTRDEAIYRFECLYGERKAGGYSKMENQGRVKIVPVFVIDKEFNPNDEHPFGSKES